MIDDKRVDTLLKIDKFMEKWENGEKSASGTLEDIRDVMKNYEEWEESEMSSFRDKVVKEEASYTQEMKNVIHDCYYDIMSAEPSEVEIMKICYELPKKIKLLAERWGWYDTEVREKVYEWIDTMDESGKK